MEQDDDVRQHLQSVSSIVNFQTLYIVKKRCIYSWRVIVSWAPMGHPVINIVISQIWVVE